MPTNAVLASIYIGQKPPVNPTASARWISQSHAHMQIPCGPNDRLPIIGNAAGNSSATQEVNPIFNTTTSRWEALVNTTAGQYFCYSQNAAGPWSVASTQCLGNGNGGESGQAIQARTILENGILYCYYMTNRDSFAKVWLASTPMPITAVTNLTFTSLGFIATRRTSVSGSNFIIANPAGGYLMFGEDGGLTLQSSIAASVAGMVASPFTVTNPSLQSAVIQYNGPYVLDAGQFRKVYERPFVVYEDGLWIMYIHSPIGVDSTTYVTRWTCRDAGIPINWVQDKVFDFLRPMHTVEIDQIADFTAAQGPNERWWAFWTAASNPEARFTIMAAPMRETMMAFDGSAWTPTMAQTDPRADLGYKKIDYVRQNPYNATNSEDVVLDTFSSAKVVVMPRASGHARLKITNSPSAVPGFDVTLNPLVATDTISSGNPITAVSAVATAITVTTRRAHNLSVLDFVTITGATPSGYNINGAAITGIPAVNQFTYTAGSSPAANTILGFYESSLAPGESRRYQCRQFSLGNWVRD